MPGTRRTYKSLSLACALSHARARTHSHIHTHTLTHTGEDATWQERAEDLIRNSVVKNDYLDILAALAPPGECHGAAFVEGGDDVHMDGGGQEVGGGGGGEGGGALADMTGVCV